MAYFRHYPDLGLRLPAVKCELLIAARLTLSVTALASPGSISRLAPISSNAGSVGQLAECSGTDFQT